MSTKSEYYKEGKGMIQLGDCLDLMDELPDNSVDLILADLPYGTTKNKWDIIIDPNELWTKYWRIAKPNAAIVLFGQDKFTATMMLSDKNHRYNIIWNKVLLSGHLNANKMPMRAHEDIMLFYKKRPTYNPQKVKGDSKSHSKGVPKKCRNRNYNHYNFVDNFEKHGEMKYPTSILTFIKPHPSKALHSTEKPVDLCEWIIKTYSNEGDVVLDNVAGSGSTGEACENTGRFYFLMEKDRDNFEIIKNRLSF